MSNKYRVILIDHSESDVASRVFWADTMKGAVDHAVSLLRVDADSEDDIEPKYIVQPDGTIHGIDEIATGEYRFTLLDWSPK